MSDSAAIDRLLPERLQRLRRATGLPVAFGGVVRPGAHGPDLVLTRMAGTRGTALRGLAVAPGLGLGGRVLARGTPQRVADYATTTAITHDYDRIVVDEERLTSVAAVPVVVLGRVRAVLYAALRDGRPLGDRAVRLMTVVAAQIARDVQQTPAPEPAEAVPAALDDLARVVAETGDPDLRARLQAIHRTLTGGRAGAPGAAPLLAPRELDVLRLVSVGAPNAEIAATLGLSPETVKAYLRGAMRKLRVHNRTAAVHAARTAGAL